SLLGGVYRVGNFLGPIIGGWVGGTFGLATAFIAFFLIGITSVGFVMQFMENIDANIQDTHNKPASVSFGKMLKDNHKVITAAGIGQWLVMRTREGWRVLIPLYAASVLNLDVQTIGLIMGFGAAFDMLFFWVSGVVMDRFGRRWA